MKWPRFGVAHPTIYHGDWGHRRWRRWRQWMWIAGGVMITIFGLSWAVRDRLFTVKHVDVVQEVAVQPDVVPDGDIQRFADRQVCTWLWLGRDSFIRNILATYPSIRQAMVVTRFPDTLQVNLLPRVPLCQLVTPSGAYVVDRTGFVFARLQQVDGKLPQIKTNKQPTIGSKVSSAGLTLGLKLITGLRSSQPPLQEIDLHDGQLDVHLAGPPLIMVAEDTDAPTVLVQLKALMDKFNSEHHFPQQVDMRFERPVIRY